jgi:hypothetical protein
VDASVEAVPLVTFNPSVLFFIALPSSSSTLLSAGHVTISDKYIKAKASAVRSVSQGGQSVSQSEKDWARSRVIAEEKPEKASVA